MIPLMTFNILLVIFFVLILYSLIDYKNKFYGNITASVIASFLGLYLASMIYLGAVQYDNGTAISDLSIALILLIPTVAMMIYSYFMVYDAYIEYQKGQEEDQ